MLNLNGNEFKSQSVTIFNNGEAGKVENVAIAVEKKKSDDPDMAPDYRVIFTDENGSVNMGIYYPTEQSTEQQIKLTVGKVLAITRAVMGAEHVFPEVSSAKEAIDVCLKLVNKNQDEAKVNVFATYGTEGTPKSYLGIYKNFDFIEQAGVTPSRLKATKNPNKPQYNDLLVRIEADAPKETTVDVSSSTDDDWV